MKRSLYLSSQFFKTIFREKFIVGLIIVLPIILILSGAMSAPDRNIALVLEGKLIQPAPTAVDISVILYVMTSLVLTSSIVSFFLGMNLKYIIPRLKQASYSSIEIILSFLIVVTILDLVMTTMVISFSLIWLEIDDLFGFFIGLFLSAIIFSTIGLIVANIADTTSLGLYLVLTLSVLDTGFLENPIYSRRYNEDWMGYMPTHHSIRLIFRSFFEVGADWMEGIGSILIYELVLLVFYLLLTRFNSSNS